MLQCSPSKRPLVHGAAFLPGETSVCGTQPPFADAAIAYAAFLRNRSSIFSAMQRISPNRAFNHVKTDQIQTVFSLQPGPTNEARDKVFLDLRRTKDCF